MKKKQALTAGVALLLMAIFAPIVHFGILPSLIDQTNMAQSIAEIQENLTLLWVAIVLLFIVIILDFIVAITLSRYLENVSRPLALASMVTRFIYGIGFGVAVFDLVKLAQAAGEGTLTNLNNYEAFVNTWDMSLFIFGIHLILVGVLFILSSQGPSWLGWLIVLAGAGYIADSLIATLQINFGFEFSVVTFIGEFLLIIWLFVRGRKLTLTKK